LIVDCEASSIMKISSLANPALGTRAALLPRHLARRSSIPARGITAASRKEDGHGQSSQQVWRRSGMICTHVVHFGTVAA
jgi:hypothetical protein